MSADVTTHAVRNTSWTQRTLHVIRRIGAKRWDAWVLLVVLIGFGALELTALRGVSTTYDEGVYWQSLRALANGQSLFGDVFSSQPPLFLLSVYPVYLIAGQSLAAARLAVTLYGMIGIGTAWWLSRRFGGALGGILVSILVAFDPRYISGAHTLDAEIPMLAAAMLAVACAEASTDRTKRRRAFIALAAILVVLAIMIKFFAVIALILIAIYTIVPAFDTKFEGHSSLEKMRRHIIPELTKDLGLLCFSIMATLLAVLLPFTNRLDRVFDETVRFHLVAGMSEPYQWQDAILRVWGRLWPSTSFKVAVLSIVILALLPSRRGALRLAPIVLWTILDFGVLVQQRPLLPHHFVILSPLIDIILGTSVALLAGDAFRSISKFRLSHSPLLGMRVVLGLGFLIVVLVSAGRDIQRSELDVRVTGTAKLNPTQQAMIRSLRALGSPHSWVVSDDQYIVALANRSVPPELVDTSDVRIQSGYLTAQQVETIVSESDVTAILFSTGRLADLPGFQEWVKQHFTLVASFGPGQMLYALGVPGSLGRFRSSGRGDFVGLRPVS